MENTNWVGVDTHKDTLACYTGSKFKEFPTTSIGFKKALEWPGNANWTIEGAYCYGRTFANYLVKNKCKVYEINPYITKSWRSALSANGNKNDYGDAKVISNFSKNLKLPEISFKTIELKEKISAREQLVRQRTAIINAIKSFVISEISKYEKTQNMNIIKENLHIYLNDYVDYIYKTTTLNYIALTNKIHTFIRSFIRFNKVLYSLKIDEEKHKQIIEERFLIHFEYT